MEGSLEPKITPHWGTIAHLWGLLGMKKGGLINWLPASAPGVCRRLGTLGADPPSTAGVTAGPRASLARSSGGTPGCSHRVQPSSPNATPTQIGKKDRGETNRSPGHQPRKDRKDRSYKAGRRLTGRMGKHPPVIAGGGGSSPALRSIFWYW